MTNKRFYTSVAAVIIFVFSCGILYSATPFEILEIHYDGTMILSSPNESKQISSLKLAGHLQEAKIYDCAFYSIDNVVLLKTDIKSMRKEILFDFKKVMEPNDHARTVEFVDNEKIIVGAESYDPHQRLSYEQVFKYLLRYDRRTGTIQKLKAFIGSFDVSLYKNRIYYRGKDGFLYFNDGDSASTSIGVTGWSPTVSPDGNRLAYISEGKIMMGLSVYDVMKNENRTLKKYFNSLKGIRWSDDGHLIAVHTTNDFLPTSLYILDSSTGQTIHEFKNNDAINWFFIENSCEYSFSH